MNQVLTLIAAYFGTLFLLAVVAIPYRRRLRKVGAELCAVAGDDDRHFIELMMKSAYSWRTSVVLLLIYTAALFQSSKTLDRESEEISRQSALMSDPRLHSLMDAHFVSAFAVNPLVGVLVSLAQLAFYVKARMHTTAEYASRARDLRALSAAAHVG
jgi:hypothetical protein